MSGFNIIKGNNCLFYLFSGEAELWYLSKTELGKIYYCKFCGRKFNYLSSMKQHALTHTGEKPYKCQLCGKTFRRKHHLEAHNLVHFNKPSI